MKKNILVEFEKYAALLNNAENELESMIEKILSPAKKLVPLSKRPSTKKREDDGHGHDHGSSGKMVGSNYITSPYGNRIDPYTGKSTFHHGIDIRAKEGTPIFSFDDGIVTKVSSDSVSGNFVAIKHKGGFSSSYSHLSQQDVKIGDHVKAGQRIGLAGSTGRSTAAHLHFRLNQDGSIIDPTPYLKDRRLA